MNILAWVHCWFFSIGATHRILELGSTGTNRGRMETTGEVLKFCFAPHHLGPELLAHTKATHEAAGAVCTVAVEFVANGKDGAPFELHVLTCVHPPKAHPVKFTRAGG